MRKIISLLIMLMFISCAQVYNEPCITDAGSLSCNKCGTSLSGSKIDCSDGICGHGSCHIYCPKCGALFHVKPLDKCNKEKL